MSTSRLSRLSGTNYLNDGRGLRSKDGPLTQRLLRIGAQILSILHADRQAHEAVGAAPSVGMLAWVVTPWAGLSTIPCSGP